ncbi:hypothetical protein HYV85_04890, partial [Candidatus Woesearchaeota archaeon]|nr:hypothetical protein [Candidatus Woesearchaeota archaeon]
MRNGLLATAAAALSLVVLFVFLTLFALPAYAHGTEADEHDEKLGGEESGVSSVIMLDEAIRQGTM